MEKLKVKHDHTLTDIVKVCIFSLFLILPILMFLPNALYYGFNEHARNSESTTINYKYETNEVNNYKDFKVGNIYKFNFGYQNEIEADDTIDIQIQILEGRIYTEQDTVYADDGYYTFGKNLYIHLFLEQQAINITINDNDIDASIYFEDISYIEISDCTFLLKNKYDLVATNITNYFTSSNYNEIESVEVNTTDTISDKIYNGWQRIWNTPLFNWTNNNNFSFTINAFTNVFGITEQSYIANYLCYIFTLIVIYIVYDIVIVLFTKLTHILHT